MNTEMQKLCRFDKTIKHELILLKMLKPNLFINNINNVTNVSVVKQNIYIATSLQLSYIKYKK